MNRKMKSRISPNNSASLKKRKSRSSKDEDFSLSEDFKKQLIGFFLTLLGALILLSVISYNDKIDVEILRRINFIDLFRKETYTFQFANWLGLVGAYASYFLVKFLFGYFSSAISLILIITGFVILRKRSLSRAIQFSIYVLLLMMTLASTFGLMIIFFGEKSVSRDLSGNTGDFIANIFYQIFGSVGASIILFFALVIIIIFVSDSNIVKSLARIKLFWEKFKESFKKEKAGLKQKAKEKELVKELESQAEREQNNQTSSDEDLVEMLKREQEKIRKIKIQKEEETEDSTPQIKETEINRPKTIEVVNKNEDKKKKDINLDRLLIKQQKKEEISETDINPENANEMDNLDNVDEDDFVEEKLEEYKVPVLELLIDPTKEESELIPDIELTENGKLLQEKLLKFGIEIQKVSATPGPVVTLYELIPAPEVKLSKIESLQDDIALAMKARGIRMIIPIPGKGTVGVEIPNSKSQIVRIKSILSSQKYNDSHKKLTVAFGKTIDGEVFIDDLSKMPHVLIAGATGSGKSVGINTIIASLLYKMHPSDLKFVMIDPKKIELSLYSKLRRHFIATSIDINESIVTSPSNAVSVLKSVELEMEQRYDKLANAGVRNIDAYNLKYTEGKLKNTEAIRHRKMPYIVVIIDELADLMITAKREIEEPIARIAQMARAVGIHLIVATQRPSVDVITGVIKANFPVRIAYQVASKVDSRTILDMGGADALLRNGDMLYLSSSAPKPIRIQNAYISTEECEKIVDYIADQKGFSKPYLLPSIIEKRMSGNGGSGDRDEMFEDAIRLILKLQQCSTSTLQRRLKLGYARAARIVDQMEAAGIVGPNQGAKGREILITEDELDDIL